MPAPALSLSHTLVPALGPLGDGWEESTLDLVLDFGAHLEPNALRHAPPFQLLAAESPTPYVQLGKQVFRGRHEELIGTELIFSPDRLAHTSVSRIVFQPVQLVEHSAVLAKQPKQAAKRGPKATPKAAVAKQGEPKKNGDQDGGAVATPSARRISSRVAAVSPSKATSEATGDVEMTEP